MRAAKAAARAAAGGRPPARGPGGGGGIWAPPRREDGPGGPGAGAKAGAPVRVVFMGTSVGRKTRRSCAARGERDASERSLAGDAGTPGLCCRPAALRRGRPVRSESAEVDRDQLAVAVGLRGG